MTPLPSVDLDLVQGEAAGYVTLFGRQHTVAAVDAAQYQRVQNHDWSSGDLSPVIDIVADLVPSLTDAERAKCKLPVLVRITQIAMGLVSAVENDIPNSSGPATSSPPAASPAT